MNIQQQQKEVNLRFYHWCLSDVQREVEADFPFLKSINNSQAQIMLKTIASFPKDERLEVVRVLTRHYHLKELRRVQGDLNLKERKLKKEFEKKFDDYRREVNLAYFLNEMSFFTNSSENHVNKDHLETVIQQELSPIFGKSPEIKIDTLTYKVLINSWIFEAFITIDRLDIELEIGYGCNIYAKDREDICLLRIDPIRYLGLVPATWNLDRDEDAFLVAQSISNLCCHIMNIIPDLISGITAPAPSPQQILIQKSQQNLNKLKDKFNRKLFEWSLENAQQEAENNFPFVRKINNLDALESLAFIETFAKSKRTQVALTLVKNTFSKSLQNCDFLTEEDEQIQKSYIQARRTMYLEPPNQYLLRLYQNLYGLYYQENQESLLKIDRRKFNASIRKELKPILGDIYKKNYLGWSYRTKVKDWYIETQISSEPKTLSYAHVIYATDHKFSALSGSIVISSAGIDLLRCLGMGSTCWHFFTEEDIFNNVRSLAEACNLFIQAAPSLLEGIDPK